MFVSPTFKEEIGLQQIRVMVEADLQKQVLGAVQLPPLRHEGLQTAVERCEQCRK